MRVPSNQPRDLLSCALAVFGMGGLIFVAQVAFIGGSTFPPLPLVALAMASMAMLVAGTRGIARMNREMADRVEGEHAKVREEVARTMGPVLARWTYDRDEWEAWTAREDAQRSRGAWAIPVVAALIGGGAGLRRGVDAAIGAAVLMAAFAAAMVAWSGSAARRRRNRSARGRTVTIATHAVLVDGGRDFWVDASTRVARVQYLAEAQPVLAVTVRYGGRAAYEHTVRLPVPRGRDGEARELAERFAEGRWHAARLPAASR